MPSPIPARPVSAIIAATLLCSVVMGDAVSEEPTHEEQVAAEIKEGLNLAAGVRAAVTEFWWDTARLPSDNQEAGIAEAQEIRGRFVNSVTVGQRNGEIVIEYGNHAAPVISGATLTLKLEIEGRQPVWTCASAYIPDRYLPEDCRSQTPQ